MNKLVITPHLTTANLYAQRGIIQQNLINFAHFENDINFLCAPAAFKKQHKALKIEQIKSLYVINVNIIKQENQSFAYGG